MTKRISVYLEDESSATATQLLRLVRESRNVDLVPSTDANGTLCQHEYWREC